MTPRTRREVFSSVSSGGGATFAAVGPQHVGNAVDNKPRTVALGFYDHKSARLAPFELRHIEAAPLIHDGQHLTAQIHDAFQKFGRFGNAGDLRRHLRDFDDGIDWNSEFVVRQTKYQDNQLFATAEVAEGASAT